MKFILEKLSRYWQLRFLAAGVGVALVVYAVLLPEPGKKSRDAQIPSVAAAPLTPPVDSGASFRSVTPTSAATPSEAPSEAFKTPWLGQNHAVEDQLKLAAEVYQQADLPRDFSESIGKLRRAADQGDVTAQFLLGHAFEVGFGVSKDMAETALWYARAAEARDSEAQSAVDPSHGPQIAPNDYAQASDFYRRAAEHGDAAAELYTALAYDLGQDVPRNAVEAARWYRKAAAQGSSSAASNLGVLYYNGDGMPKDSVEAAAWFRNAAERGSASAQYCLGRMYYHGDGLAQSYTQAAVWLEKAARQGNSRAQVLLSLMYATGQGVPGSTPMAYMWINLASATEDQARISRTEIEKVIPAAEIAEGQRLTHDWLTEHGRSIHSLR